MRKFHFGLTGKGLVISDLLLYSDIVKIELWCPTMIPLCPDGGMP